MSVPSDLHSRTLDCFDCLLWELRYRVAARVSYDLTIRLSEPALRQRVLDDITLGWRRRCETGASADGFDGFYAEYMAAIERNADRTAYDLDREWRRVWTEYAQRLG